MNKGLIALVSMSVCLAVGMSYEYFNERYVIRWWVHCKHCAGLVSVSDLESPASVKTVQPASVQPAFDANDFTMLFFACLWLFTTAPLFFVFRQQRRIWALLAAIINAIICCYFMQGNLWG